DQITWITKAAAVCCSKAVFRLPHRALPRSQIRESSAQQNHNRFTRFNNFLDWLLDVSPLPDPGGSRMLFVGSSNPANVQGLEWFLDQVLPKIRKKSRMSS